jgi:hypothetical protein
MIRFPRRWSSAVVAAAIAIATPAFAASARLERVILLPAVDRSSVVFELSAEPRNVSTRRISDSVVELEAGPFDAVVGMNDKPGVDAAAHKLLKAPSNVRFIDSVSVRMLSTDAGPIVRARITLSAMAQAVARSAGRRVYVDVSAMPPPAPGAPSTATAARAATATARPTTPAVQATPEDTYRAGMRPSIDKLKEMSPFLTSAAASGDPKVTGALLPALLSLRASVAAQQPPDAARGSHTMVLGAVDRIMRALSPDFTGDRASTVKQSVTTIDVVGGVLIGD